MSASKRPSTSSLRRFITSRPYVPIAELRRRFGLDDPDAMSRVGCNGTSAFVGLPEREATKLEDLWQRGEVGLELSVEVHAPVVVGVYPMRIARYVTDQANGNGYPSVAQSSGNGGAYAGSGHPRGGGHRQSVGGRNERHQPRSEPQPEEQYATE
jgi:hypothetical protein